MVAGGAQSWAVVVVDVVDSTVVDSTVLDVALAAGDVVAVVVVAQATVELVDVDELGATSLEVLAPALPGAGPERLGRVVEVVPVVALEVVVEDRPASGVDVLVVEGWAVVLVVVEDAVVVVVVEGWAVVVVVVEDTVVVVVVC